MQEPTAEQLKEEGLRLFQQGQTGPALAVFEKAAVAYENEGEENGRAEMLNNIGVIQRTRKNNQAAIEAFNEALTIFTAQGDQNRQAQTLANLADLYAFTGQKDEAARCYGESAALFAQTGDRQRQSQVLRAYSLMQLRRGQWLDAMMRMEESLNARPRLGPFRWIYRGLLRFALSLFGVR